MKKVFAGFLCGLCLCTLFGCGSTETEETAKTEETSAVGTELDENVQSTPYGNLPLPESYIDVVTTKVESEDPYTISFYNASTGVKLYTLYYGQEQGDFLGTLNVDGNKIALYAAFESLDEKSDDYNYNYSLQSEINAILDSLESAGNFTKGE